MAFQEIAAGRRFVKFKECKIDEIVTEGFFLGERQGKFGPQYEIEEADGKVCTINASGQLKYKFQFIQPGDYIRVVYKGVEILESGDMKGRECHTFAVMKDPDYRGRPINASGGGHSASESDDDCEDIGGDELL